MGGQKDLVTETYRTEARTSLSLFCAAFAGEICRTLDQSGLSVREVTDVPVRQTPTIYEQGHQAQS